MHTKLYLYLLKILLKKGTCFIEIRLKITFLNSILETKDNVFHTKVRFGIDHNIPRDSAIIASLFIKHMSFQQARYTDPQTKLYYATAEEFTTVRSLPMDITAGYLALRGASSIVG